MRKAILAVAILGTMFTAAQAAEVDFSGKFGYRNDNFEVGAVETKRDRFAASLEAASQIDSKTKVVIGLRTGSTKSSWVDMGGENSLKNIDLNLAYVEYAAAPFAKVTLGKMHQPWKSEGLMFDPDIKPEGLAVALKHDSGLYGNVFKLKLSEGQDSADSTLDGLQVGFVKKFDGMAVDLHAALLEQDVKTDVVCILPVPAAPCRNLPLETDLQVLGLSVAKEVAGMPVKAFVQQVKNDKANKLDTATAYGVTFGHAKNPGDWEVSVVNQKSEANALSGVWTDSDFAGGAVAHDGLALRGAYALADGWKVRGAYYDAEVGAVRAVDTKRLMFDLVYSF